MEASIRAGRARGEANHGERPGRVPGGAVVPGGATMTRIARLAALLDEPLLVTSGINVRYLTSLASSNAAVLVESDGTRRSSRTSATPSARARSTIRFERTARAVIGDLATRLAGRTIGVEAHVLDGRVARGAQGRRGRDRPAVGPRREAARRQGAHRDRDPEAGGCDFRRGVRRARRGALRRPNRARARLACARALPRARLRRSSRSTRPSPRRRTARVRMRRYAMRHPREHARHDRRRLPHGRLRVGLHADVRDRRSAGRARPRV